MKILTKKNIEVKRFIISNSRDRKIYHTKLERIECKISHAYFYLGLPFRRASKFRSTKFGPPLSSSHLVRHTTHI